MPILTGARYAVRVLADHRGYVTSTEIMDTPGAIGAINTDNYTRYGVYGSDRGEITKTDGDIELHLSPSEDITSSWAFFTVLLSRHDIASGGAVFVMFAPPRTPVQGLDFGDSYMTDGRVTLLGTYVAGTAPTFFLGVSGIAPPPTSFWTSFVGSREII